MRTHHHIKKSIPDRMSALAGGVALLIAVSLLAGCAVGPQYVQPELQLPENWGEGSAQGLSTKASPDTTWWKAFNDPTLDSLVEMAYHQNLPLQVAGLRIMEARAELAVASGRQYPQLQAFFGSATAVGLTEQGASSVGLDRDFWDFQVGFDAAWEIDLWNRLGVDVQAHTADYFATVGDYNSAIVSLTAEVARTYAVIRTFEVLIELARKNAAIQEEGLRIANARFENGATSELDVTQATTLFESTRASIPQLEIGLQQAMNAMSTLLGLPPGSVPGLASGPKAIPTATSEVSVSMPAELLRRRPDVLGAEYSAVAQCARIGIPKADLYPRFTLFGSIGTQGLSSAETRPGQSFSKIFEAGSFFYSFGPRLLWPILDYGRTKNRVRVEDARFQQTLVEYHDTVLKAAQEVEDGIVGYQKSQESVVFAQRAVDGAQRSVDLSTVQYREGAVDYQRVLDAQRSLLQVENDLTNTQSAIATNRIALYKALGGGWEVRRNDPVVSDSTRVEMQSRTNWGDSFFDSTSVTPPDTSTQTQ